MAWATLGFIKPQFSGSEGAEPGQMLLGIV